MSSISFLDKIEVKNNHYDIKKHFKTLNNTTPDYRVDLQNDPEVSEVITLVPERKPFTYSNEPRNLPCARTLHNNINNQYLRSKKLINSNPNYDGVSEHPNGQPCYAEMLGIGHGLAHLVPLFSSIKNIVTNVKKTISEISLPNGFSFVTHPLNKLMCDISNRLNFAFGPINPFLSNPFVHSKDFYSKVNDQKMARYNAEINDELLNPNDSNPLINNAISQMTNPWKIFKEDVESKKTADFGAKLQNFFEVLRYKSELNDMFTKKIGNALYEINGINISTISSPQIILARMASVMPDYESRQLISAYAHEGIFTPAYLKLISKHPVLAKYSIKTPIVSYKINKIDKDTFKLIATNLVKLNSFVDPSIAKYHSFGIRTSVLFSKNHNPFMKNAFFVN